MSRWRWGMVALLVLPACMPPGDTDGGAATDADPPAWAADAGTMLPRDAASGADGAAPSPDGGPSPERGEYHEGTPDAVAGMSCFDGVDNDGDDDADCADRSCRANVPVCCIGVSDAVCCVESDAIELPIAMCEGPVTDCAPLLALAEPFGSPTSEVLLEGELTRAFVPRGQASDSGILFHQALDPRAQMVTLEARIAGAMHTEGADVLAVGLVRAERAAELVRVVPAVAVMVSGNRGDVSLLVAGEVVARRALPSRAFHTYRLSVRPDGVVRLHLDTMSEPIATARLSLMQPLRPVIYGRTFNPSPGSASPVRLGALAIHQATCDIPSALGTSRAQVLPPPGATDPLWASVERIRGPSVLRWADAEGATHERMAVEIDGAIHLARSGAEGWELTGALDAPALRGGAAWAADGLGDPALRFDAAAGALELWFTGYSNESGTVARVRAATGTETFEWNEVEILFAPDEATPSFTQPAPFVDGGVTYVVMRSRASSGTHAITLHRLGTGSAITLRAAQSDDIFAFDRDEVSSPVVLSTPGVHRLYYAGRRGSRWSIGMLASPDGFFWTPAPTAEPTWILEPSGAGFDALGVRDPSLVIDGTTLHLYYGALDASGVARVGVVTGHAPPSR